MVPPTLEAFPSTAAEITPEWLTRALEPRHPGAVVQAVQLVDQTEMTNSHARLQVEYRDEEIAGAQRLQLALEKTARGLLVEGRLQKRGVGNDARADVPVVAAGRVRPQAE